MQLLTKAQTTKLLANGAKRYDDANPKPVVKLFTPWGSATWLITELDPEDPTIAFGLCDLGFGEPELGSVDLTELMALQGPWGLRVERDRHFEPTKTIGEYADEARGLGRIAA